MNKLELNKRDLPSINPQTTDNQLVETDAATSPETRELAWENPTLSAGEYGNKAANLSTLSALFEGDSEVIIPSFMGIGHAEVQKHLALYYPEYEGDWNRFLTLKGKAQGLDEESESQLLHIQRRIEEAFIDHPFSSPALEAFVSYSEGNQELLMVRSTGAEDSSDMANAGGNHTENGVWPISQEISQAIGKVIASYHSPLSITQRESVGQEIKKAPQTPVLLQVMVGEAENGPIPVSGIAYSREILGRTESLTQIQALYGHNEAAVNALLPIDTFYVYPDGNCHQIICHKQSRLVTQNYVGLSPSDNPKHLQDRPSLSESQVQLIERVSRTIHDHYKMAMDIEWVYDTSRDLLCLVQARPVVEKFPMDPETLDLEALDQPVTKQEAEAVISVQGKLQVITDPSEVLVEKDLPSAFNRFSKLAQEGAHEQIKVIIVREPAVATSHFACTFREMGVDLFVCPEIDLKVLDKPEGYIALDGQRELMLSGQRFPGEIVKKGWFRSPIAAIESLQEKDPFSEIETTRLFQELLEEGPPAIMNMGQLRTLLDMLGSTKPEEGRAAARTLMKWIYFAVKNLPMTPRSIQLLRNAARIAEPLLFSEDMPLMHRLHAAKRLQALILQQATARIVGSDSLLQLIAEKKVYDSVTIPDETVRLSEEEEKLVQSAEAREIQRLMKEGVPVKKRIALITPMGDEEVKRALSIYRVAKSRCLSSKTKAAWKALSDQVASTRSRYLNQLLIQSLNFYHSQEILGEWLNLVVPDLSVEGLLADAANRHQAADQFEALSKLRENLATWEGQIDQWSDPGNFMLLKGRFAEFVFAMREHMAAFDTLPSNLALKCASMTLYKRFIDLYDQTIKSLRGSPFFSDKALQARAFKEILTGYIEISILWTTRIPDETMEAWTEAIRSQQEIPDLRAHITNAMVEQLHAIEQLDARQLRPSAGFNVAARMINSSQLDSSKSLEECTLEDLFMLAHQNVLAALDAIFHPPWESSLPPSVQRLQTLVETTLDFQGNYFFGGNVPIKATLLSCTHNAKSITLTFNLPIKYHSAKITLQYDRETEKVTFDFSMLGHNMGNRMGEILDNLIFRALVYDFHFQSVPAYDEEIETLQATWMCDSLSEPSSWESLGYILQTVMAIAQETLVGSLSKIQLNKEEMDQGNPRFWETLFSTPEKLRRWMNAGAPHLESVFRSLSAKPEIDLLEKLFQMMGLTLEESQEELSQRVLKAFVNACPTMNEQLSQVEGAGKLLLDYLEKHCLEYRASIDNLELNEWLAERQELILHPPTCTPAVHKLVSRIQFLILFNLISSPQATIDDVRGYLEFLIERGQRLNGILTSIVIDIRLAEFDEKRTFALDFLQQQVHERHEVGYTPPYGQRKLKGRLDHGTLNEGDKVFAKNRWGEWCIGQIVGRNSEGELLIDTGDILVLTVRRERRLYPIRLID